MKSPMRERLERCAAIAARALDNDGGKAAARSMREALATIVALAGDTPRLRIEYELNGNHARVSAKTIERMLQFRDVERRSYREIGSIYGVTGQAIYRLIADKGTPLIHQRPSVEGNE